MWASDSVRDRVITVSSSPSIGIAEIGIASAIPKKYWYWYWIFLFLLLARYVPNVAKRSI